MHRNHFIRQTNRFLYVLHFYYLFILIIILHFFARKHTQQNRRKGKIICEAKLFYNNCSLPTFFHYDRSYKFTFLHLNKPLFSRTSLSISDHNLCVCIRRENTLAEFTCIQAMRISKGKEI